MSDGRNFIELRSVSMSVGSQAILRETSLSIRQGEFFSLLGPSGCGKTSLLRILGGFAAPSSGRVFVDGVDVTALPPARRPSNMVFQSYAIFPHLDVTGNVAFGLHREPLDKAEKKRRIEEALELVKLTGLQHRRPDQLSGGQRQRVALARAIVKRPKLLLLDEPLSALDKKLREDMQVELRRIQRELRTTFIFVTHDQQEALALSDRIAIMNAGRIVQVDTPKEIYGNPRELFAAEFVGSMNFFPGTVTGSTDGRLEVDAEHLGALALVARAGDDPAKGERVTLGIRPENIWITGASSTGKIGGEIVGKTFLGERVSYHVRLAGRTQEVTVSRGDSARQGDEPQEGQQVALDWADRDVRLFRTPDGATQR